MSRVEKEFGLTLPYIAWKKKRKIIFQNSKSFSLLHSTTSHPEMHRQREHDDLNLSSPSASVIGVFMRDLGFSGWRGTNYHLLFSLVASSSVY